MNPFTSAVSEISGNPVHIAGLPLTLGFIADFAGLHAQPEADVLIYAMFMAVCVLFAVCINLHVTFPTKEITDISERKRLLDTLDRFRKTCTAVYFLNTAVFAAFLLLPDDFMPFFNMQICTLIFQILCQIFLIRNINSLHSLRRDTEKKLIREFWITENKEGENNHEGQ